MFFETKLIVLFSFFSIKHERKAVKMKKLQILIIVFLISLSICALEIKQVKACEYITVTQTANGQISPGTTAVEWGDTPIFNITPNAGYHIASITANGAWVAVASPLGQYYQFSPITGDGSLTATFALNTYTSTVTQTPNGQISPGTTSVDYGLWQDFNIIPNNGYYIASITTDAGPVAVTYPSGQTFAFLIVTADHTITATFAVETYAMTVFAGAHGTVTPGNQTVNSGAALSFAITPDIGYHVANVDVNGTSVGKVTSYNFTATGPTSIAAAFMINSTSTDPVIKPTSQTPLNIVLISIIAIAIIIAISAIVAIKRSKRKPAMP